MITPTEHPVFVPRYRPDHGGNDFLGLRAVNTTLMGQCLPGINNVSQYLRPFSLIAWIFWKFYQLASAAHLKSPTNEQQRIWQEKVELLFTWSHVLNGVQGIPGTRAVPPDGGRVPLDFGSWKRKPDSTSLLAAIQYGPPAKSTYGLAFIEETESGLLRTTGNGIELAEALDKCMSGSERKRLLQDIGEASATSNEISTLYQRWSILSPTPREKRAFRSAFYSESSIGDGTRTGSRSATVRMILHVLDTAKDSLDEGEVRAAIFHGLMLRRRTSSVPDNLTGSWKRWICLQVRQAQRLAMESLLGWVERRLIYSRDRDTRPMVLYINELWEKHRNIVPLQPTVAGVLKKFALRDLDDALRHSYEEDGWSLFTLMNRVLEGFRNADDIHVLHALRILFLCREYTKHLSDGGAAEADLNLGGAERLSLRHWCDTLERCGSLTVQEFLQLILEQHIISQHLSVAARRYDGGTQRLRISIEEEGMVALVTDALPLRVTPDRLGTALSLMSQCDMIDFSDDGYAYSTKHTLVDQGRSTRAGA